MLKGTRECARAPVLWRTEEGGSKKPRTSAKETWCARLEEGTGELCAQLARVLGLPWLAAVSWGLLPAPGPCLEVTCNHFPPGAGCWIPGGPSEEWGAGASQYCSFPALPAAPGEGKGNSLSAGGKTRQPVGVSSLQQFKEVGGKWVLEMISPNSRFYRLAN